MRIIVQNLQKSDGLATDLFEEYEPDVMLVEEINLHSEQHPYFPARSVSRMGYGTAIRIRSKKLSEVTNIKYAQSPYAELGGMIRKKTTIATIYGQTFKDKDKLVAHVDAVLAELDPGPAIWMQLRGNWLLWILIHVAIHRSRFCVGSGFRSRPGNSKSRRIMYAHRTTGVPFLTSQFRFERLSIINNVRKNRNDGK